MHATPSTVPTTDRSAPVVLVLRVLGALLLLGIAVIHGYLWQQGYSSIAVIGPAFLLQTGLAVAGALLLLVVPHRWLPWAAGAGALLALGSLAALIMSTTVGVFGFSETTAAQLWWESLWVEIAAVVVLAPLTVLAFRRR